MLINCPRCGFQQPKDTYCAQCGVDMETYVPPTPPAWKRVVGSPIVQLSVLIIIAAAVGGTLYQQGQQTLERRVGPLTSSIQVSSSNNPTPSDGENNSASETSNLAEEAAVETVTPPSEPAPDAADGTVTAYKIAPPAAVATEEKSKDSKSAARVEAPQVLVYYAEVSRETLNGLFAASRGTGQFMEFNDYSAGLIPSISKTLTGSQIKILHKEVKTLEGAKNLQWFYGIKDPREANNEIGLTTFLGISDVESNTLRGNVEIQRSWREPLPSGGFEVQKRSFPAEFEVDAESGFFISGVMPRRSYLDNDQDLSNIEIYKILASPQFRSGESNFVIFIDFENGN